MSVTRDAPREVATADVTVLAFDFGTKKIGVAVGNTAVRIAHPLTTIIDEREHARFAVITALIAEWQPGALVVGRPLHADGSEHEMTARAERFARSLEGRYRLPVSRVDERYTTKTAERMLVEAGAGKVARRAARDEVAAQTILQAWLDESGHDGRRESPA